MVALRESARASSASASINLSGVSKVFESRHGHVIALEEINLAVRPKEFVCIIGPSGCGKSTILGLIAGLTKPSAGNLLINGQPISEARQAHEIGLVFQDAVLLPWRTVEENAALPLEVLKVPKSERREKVKGVLDLVRLEGFERIL